MKLTLLEVNSIFNTLQKMSGAKLDIDTAFKLIGFIEVVEKHNTFYLDRWKNIINKYKIEEEDGVNIKNEDMEQYEKDMKELHEYEVEVPEFKLNKNDLEGAELTLGELYIIKKIITM